MYQNGWSIKKLLERVANNELLLPAIQREFVWKPEQICTLFDSMMQGYPFGTFLFWKIRKDNYEKYQFYKFMQNYHQRDNIHCEKFDGLPQGDFISVLDGQQRITALNIGLRGSYAWKNSGARWNNDNSFPSRYLYLNLLSKEDEESTSRYQFNFMTAEDVNNANHTSDNNDKKYWFRISRTITETEDDLIDEISDLEILGQEEKKIARDTLRKLIRTISQDMKFSYYEEEDQDLEKVLNIFIRLNSGGTVLSYSDLLLSIAAAQWKKTDAREEIHGLVDEMNKIGDGFNISKDLVLKAGLMLSDLKVGFKVENFNKESMTILEEHWQPIKQVLLLTMELLASYGFNGQNLKAANSILPIAYYLYKKSFGEDFLLRAQYAADREAIKKWLMRSLLKASSIWGGSTDTWLTLLRSIIRESNSSDFPVQELEAIMASRGKSLQFTEEEIDELVELEYGNPRTFILLTLLFSASDFSRHSFHIDHIYPKGLFSKQNLNKLDIDNKLQDKIIDYCNRLPNLQLLDGSVNNEKRQKMPHEWLASQWSKDQVDAYLQTQAITYLPDSLSNFQEFYEKRKENLKVRIKQILSTQGN